MNYSKSFPRRVKGTNLYDWEEIYLTDQEEKEQEKKCREDNIRIMEECIGDAKDIIDKKGLKRFQSDMVSMAIALFRKRASYEIHWKESKAKEKFDKKKN